MPFLSESITDPPTARLAATALAAHHVHIRPLALPVVARTPGPPHHGIRMRSVCMPADYRQAAEAIRGLAVRPDDVWVVGYPGSGAAAVQLLVERLLRIERQADGHEEQPEAEQTPLLE